MNTIYFYIRLLALWPLLFIYYNKPVHSTYSKHDQSLLISNLGIVETQLNKPSQDIKQYKYSHKYGPLHIDLTNYKTKDQIYILPAKNASNARFFIAITCTKKLINVTDPEINWKGWQPPKVDFEKSLINDICNISI